MKTFIHHKTKETFEFSKVSLVFFKTFLVTIGLCSAMDSVRHVEGGRSPVRSTEANSVARSTPTRAKRGTRPKNKK